MDYKENITCIISVVRIWLHIWTETPERDALRIFPPVCIEMVWSPRAPYICDASHSSLYIAIFHSQYGKVASLGKMHENVWVLIVYAVRQVTGVHWKVWVTALMGLHDWLTLHIQLLYTERNGRRRCEAIQMCSSRPRLTSAANTTKLASIIWLLMYGFLVFVWFVC